MAAPQLSGFFRTNDLRDVRFLGFTNLYILASQRDVCDSIFALWVVPYYLADILPRSGLITYWVLNPTIHTLHLLCFVWIELIKLCIISSTIYVGFQMLPASGTKDHGLLSLQPRPQQTVPSWVYVAYGMFSAN